MSRIVSSALVAALSSLFLTSPVVAQEPSRTAHVVTPTWEYGVLEIAQSGGGDAYVFCRFTAEGCAEVVVAVRALPPSRPAPAASDTRQGSYDASAARAIATLGLAGWDVVSETRVGVPANGAPVLLFRRPARR
jgi:hypothetical protein